MGRKIVGRAGVILDLFKANFWVEIIRFFTLVSYGGGRRVLLCVVCGWSVFYFFVYIRIGADRVLVVFGFV